MLFVGVDDPIDIQAVIKQKFTTAKIENGKNAMPSFVGKLSEQDIIDVAAYVELKAEKGWQR